MSLERQVCEALKEMGYPQGDSHLRWYWWAEGTFAALICPASFGELAWHKSTAEGSEAHIAEWAACPDALDALDWLEHALRYGVSRDYRGNWYAKWPSFGAGSAQHPPEGETPPRQEEDILFELQLMREGMMHLEGETPEELILRIYEHWKAEQAKAEAEAKGVRTMQVQKWQLDDGIEVDAVGSPTLYVRIRQRDEEGHIEDVTLWGNEIAELSAILASLCPPAVVEEVREDSA